jgi:hypothetical protein
VTNRTGPRNRSGFVRDVSLDNGLKIVSRPDGDENFIQLIDAVPDISRANDGYGCTEQECKRWLKNGSEISCDVYLRALEANPAR